MRDKIESSNRCDECAYYEPAFRERGYCHRYPPGEGSLRRGHVSASEWCGEFLAFDNRAGEKDLFCQVTAIAVFKTEFRLGQMVSKKSGSWWEGRVVGFYSTEQTPDGVCVQLDLPMGPVQIYPASALELVERKADD